MAIIGSRKGWAALNARKRKPLAKRMKCYEQRAKNLTEIGYASYQEYLKSDEWRAIRNAKLEKNPLCLICNNTASQVHHLSYDFSALLGLNRLGLVTLCDACH